MDIIICMDHVERKSDVTVCEQQRRRPAYTFAQSDKRLCSSLSTKFN